MKNSKRLLISAVLSASVIGSQHTISSIVKAAQVSIIPNMQSNAYNANNIFTKCGYKGQCTWFTYGRVMEKLGISLPSEFYGNAVEWWYGNSKSNVYPCGSEPRANSIAVWGGGNLGYGHVGFVEKVEGNTVYLNEGNFNIRKSYDGSTKALSTQAMKNRGNLYLKGYIYLSGGASNSNNSYNPSPSRGESTSTNYDTVVSGRITVGTSLNVRNKASISSNIIGSLGNNANVYIIGESNGWYKIKYNNSIGYISSKYVSTSATQSSNDSKIFTSEKTSNNNSTSMSATGVVTLSNANSYLNVRNNPNTNSSVVGSLKHGSNVKILGKSNNWYKISYNNSIAYVNSQYIGNKTTNTTSNNNVKSTVSTNYSNKYGVVTLRNKNSRLNVRDGASISSKVISSISCGTKVQMLGSYNGWYKIKYGYVTGFVSTTYIK